MQAVKDTNAQLAGKILPNDDNAANKSLSEDNILPEQIILVESLITIPVKWDIKEEWQ